MSRAITIERVALTGSTVNRNNIAACNPFVVTDLSGKPVTSPATVNATACAECGRVFDSFSKLYAHKAKPCAIRDEDLTNPVHVRFPVDQVYNSRLLGASLFAPKSVE